MAKVSIIVPIYNAETYLDNCIRSLVSQDYSDIEIILVNDGSKDRSKDIIDFWKEKDARITCINQENQGVTRARKKGVDIACGEWITFVDADDEISSNAIETLVSASKGYDIVIGSVFTDCEWPFLKFDGEMSQKEYMHDLLINRFIHWGPVAKLFQRRILCEHVFDIPQNITNGEDFIFNIRTAIRVNKVKIINKNVYHYIRRPESASSKNPFISIKYCLSFEKEVWKSFRGVRKKYFLDYGLRTLKTFLHRFRLIVQINAFH